MEKDSFATKEEAQNECDKRNKGEKKMTDKKQTIKKLEIRIISINYMLNINKTISCDVRSMYEAELSRLSKEYEELTKEE